MQRRLAALPSAELAMLFVIIPETESLENHLVRRGAVAHSRAPAVTKRRSLPLNVERSRSSRSVAPEDECSTLKAIKPLICCFIVRTGCFFLFCAWCGAHVYVYTSGLVARAATGPPSSPSGICNTARVASPWMQAPLGDAVHSIGRVHALTSCSAL